MNEPKESIGAENVVDLIQPESTAEQRARYRPDEADAADIEQALEGLPIYNRRRSQMIRCECRRCREKNHWRVLAGVDQLDDEGITDGDPVTIFAIHNTDTALGEQYWRLTSLYHREHPYRSLTEHAVADTDIVRACATIRIVDAKSVRQDRLGDDTVVTDVSVVKRSPKGKGKPRDPPSSSSHIEAPTDAVTGWPQETVDWFEQVKADYELRTSLSDGSEKAGFAGLDLTLSDDQRDDAGDRPV